VVGNRRSVPVRLVDDRDGRIVAELSSDAVPDVLDRLAHETDWPPHLMLVCVSERQRAVIGTHSKAEIRSLDVTDEQ
jgi:hypothetical protein